MQYKIIKSPNYSVNTRKKATIKFLIIHYTGMQSKRASILRLTSIKSKVSCHYLIDREGKIIQLVSDNKIAWHAGKSQWKNFKKLNENSIGIELVNKGHSFGYQTFTKKQISKLEKLCLFLKKKYKIKTCNVLGHSDIAPLRKIDPGEKFPWHQLSKKKLGIWYKENYTNQLSYKKKESRNFFFKNLFNIGYRYFSLKKKNIKDRVIIKSFQSKFLPKNVTGKIDQKTYKISHYLANKQKKNLIF